MLINRQPQRYQAGLGIIESLIALLVISIGLLGIAALQLTGMQQSSSAHWHSQAVWVSYEITDRISALSANDADNFDLYDGIDTDQDYNMDCQDNPCNPQQMVIADAQDWANMIDLLPGGRGVIRSQANNTLTVSVMWEDNAGQSNCVNNEPDADNKSCYTVTITP